ncbi:unnamed protein product (macronuclear) [Paramecium tetraurelia]|uniref:Ion transport domain-containing protein n=1 Tax=Paramecium tetraurelia TaxID=5888 RepID=A0BHC5_PARTE|nr:uncharacterized protein GSPATT00028977001 [Paramecium tetraurelia]CAK57942.1 unnamed protein product [Paramecium tetraurelia]|eukprot:XP_001425340.1 hypothetical protein (macronuclear) [Paramecium tetraurelia strain d4-2]
MADEMPEVDQLIYKSRNLGKNWIREIKIVSFIILMIVFVLLELTINGKCLLTRDKWMFLMIDCIMYLGVFAISVKEIKIQNQKKNKKQQMQIRLRALNCKSLRIYLCFILTILLLCIIHLGVQIYFFTFQFCQECFYYKGSFKDTKDFEFCKILLFIVFIIIEIITIFFLVWIVKENWKAMRKPEKFRRSRVEIGYSDDIVLKINS